MKSVCQAKLELLQAMFVNDDELRRIALVLQREIPNFGGVVTFSALERQRLADAVDTYVRVTDPPPRKTFS